MLLSKNCAAEPIGLCARTATVIKKGGQGIINLPFPSTSATTSLALSSSSSFTLPLPHHNAFHLPLFYPLLTTYTLSFTTKEPRTMSILNVYVTSENNSTELRLSKASTIDNIKVHNVTMCQYNHIQKGSCVRSTTDRRLEPGRKQSSHRVFLLYTPICFVYPGGDEKC